MGYDIYEISFLAYIRKGETEDVLIALNPSDSPVSCKIMVQQAGKIIYSNHGEAELTDSILSMPVASATFFNYNMIGNLLTIVI